MAAPELTPAAIAEIKRLVENADFTRPVVVVVREGRKVDKKRGPNGETIWKLIAEAGWTVVVFEYNPLRDTETTRAYGLEFSASYLDRALRLDFKDGMFVVAGGSL